MQNECTAEFSACPSETENLPAQQPTPSARPLAPQGCARSFPRRCCLMTSDGPLLEWNRAAPALQRCPRSLPRRGHCHSPLCRCRLLAPDARRGQLLECHRAAPDGCAVIGIVDVMYRCLPTDFRDHRLVTDAQPVRSGTQSPRNRGCMHDDAHWRSHAKRQWLPVLALHQRVQPQDAKRGAGGTACCPPPRGRLDALGALVDGTACRLLQVVGHRGNVHA